MKIRFSLFVSKIMQELMGKISLILEDYVIPIKQNQDERILIKQLYKNYREACLICESLKKIYGKGRKPNFPEMISEYIAKKITGSVKPKTGDLSFKNKKLEVKAFASNGPISFGPKEPWDILILVDLINQPKLSVKVFNIPSSDKYIQNMKITKNTTFGDSAKKGKRPRITPSEILKKLPKPMCVSYYCINDILNGHFEKENEVLKCLQDCIND
jgi:hypothetical protein